MIFLDEGFGMKAVLSDGQKFTRLDVADVSGTQKIEGAGFAGDAPAVAESGKRQRSECVTVPRYIHGVFGQDDNAKAAGEFGKRFFDGFLDVWRMGSGYIVQKNFGIRSRLKNMPGFFHLGAEFGGICQVAVVGDG